MSLVKELAQSILDTAKAREESYDHVAADLAATTAQNNGTHDNAERHYKLSLQAAAVRECPAALVQPVYMLLNDNWNEALDWAKEHA